VTESKAKLAERASPDSSAKSNSTATTDSQGGTTVQVLQLVKMKIFVLGCWTGFCWRPESHKTASSPCTTMNTKKVSSCFRELSLNLKSDQNWQKLNGAAYSNQRIVQGRCFVHEPHAANAIDPKNNFSQFCC